MKILLKYLILLIIILTSYNCNNKSHRFKAIGLSIKLPGNYIKMETTQFEDYFKNNNIADSIINNKVINIENFLSLRNSIYLQDTTNIYNNILLMGVPYINLNQKSFKQIKKVLYNSVKKSYPTYHLTEISSTLKSGTYPYAKLIYQINNCFEDFQITYYVLNKQNQSKIIMIHNQSNLSLEDMISTIE
ncbi:hypothetical protein [Plebeiibacterium sediminum]|uniref:Uncharacterized protein n=1 Tax=Plebeiibacterium sediminum TaxID=2992112 RepID=A0AAE3M219_9BACT|nr:hypothetical protein [Plebeiobacterium sediminum]MCW3785846.1 hypothetical protein [Plebeiobacterium sediminum]